MVFTLNSKKKGRGGEEKRNIKRAGRTLLNPPCAVPIGKGFPLRSGLWDLRNCSQHHLLSFSIGCTFKQASQSALLNKHEGSGLGEYSWSSQSMLFDVLHDVCDPTIKGCITVQLRRINTTFAFMFPDCAGQRWVLLSLLHSLS